MTYAGASGPIRAYLARPKGTAKLPAIVVNMYEGTQHAFHNDAAGARYNKDAAELAWRRTVEFLNATLKS